MKTHFKQFFLVWVLLTLALIGTVTSLTSANDQAGLDLQQDSTEEATETAVANIELSGVVTSLEGTVIVVNGLSIDIATAEIEGVVNVGANVYIEGRLEPNAVIIALVIEVEGAESTEPAPESTAEATELPESTAVPTEPAPEATPIVVEDGAIIIVIEGPVEAININIVTIYGINIVLTPDDPVLTVIQIGDVIRIQGALSDSDDDNVIVVVAITIVFVDIDVFVFEGQVWRDAGNCNNPPPPWAPANGWRRRCENNGGGGGGGSGGKRGGSS